jgi:hypothetical protein
MSRMKKARKTKSDDILTEADLAAWCPDLSNWARSWCIEGRDLAAGERIVTLLTPFLFHLLSLDLTRATRNRHRDNLWMLGGEAIRRLNEAPELRKRPVEELVRAAICDGEGPLLYGCMSEAVQNSFDSTCRKLHRFLIDS